MSGSANASRGFGIPTVPTGPGRDDLVHEARRRLRRSGYSALGEIHCEVEATTLRLHGRLPSYYLKQLAQEIVVEIPELQRVVNLIVVSGSAGRPAAAGEERAGSSDSRGVGNSSHL